MNANSPPAIVRQIRARTSWRAYTGEPIQETALAELRAAMAEVEGKTPFGNRPRFEIISRAESGNVDLDGMVTYGVIKDPPAFLVGAIARGKGDIEDFGFAFEALVLKATDLGLGTCWLGGTFSRSLFARAIRLGADELMPAISPIGQPTATRALRDRAMRLLARSRNRKPWRDLFFDETTDRPLTDLMAGPSCAIALEMVRLGPSARNRQPWRIIRRDAGKRFDLYVFREPGLANGVKPGGIDMVRLDAGIALCHFELTARALGLAGQWTAAEVPAAKVPHTYEFIASWRCG